MKGLKYHNVFLGIDYDEAYKAVTVTKRDGDEVRFETGDPEADYQAACEFAREEAERSGAERIMTSSSLNDFVFEVPGWKYDDEDNLIPDPRDRIKTVTEVCGACPMVWEGTMEDGTFFYARYRYGSFRVGFGADETAASGDVTYQQNYGDGLDGVMSWDEALPLFTKAIQQRNYPREEDDA